MMKFVKNCPECGAKQTYTWPQSFKKAVKNNVMCGSCANYIRLEIYGHWNKGKLRGKNHPTWKDPKLRFWAKVNKKGKNQCWEWTAARDPFGYGRFGLNGKICTASRFSWELHYSPISKGMCVLHKCDNPPCVNPNHLFLGTRSDNVADMIAKGRRRSENYRSK